MVALIGLRKNLSAPNRAPKLPFRLNQSGAGRVVNWYPDPLSFHDFAGISPLTNFGAGVEVIPGLSAQAWDFNGSTSYVGTTAWTGPIVVPFAMECWFETDDLSTSTVIWSITDGSDTNWFSCILRGAEVNNPVEAFQKPGDGARGGEVSSGLNHIETVFKTATSRLMYLNGVLVATATGGGVPAGLDRIAFGKLWRGTSELNFNGRIFRPVIRNYAPSAAEIAGRHFHDRWGIYRHPGRVTYFVPGVAPAGGRVMSKLAGAGGLAGMGGIAGQGGGLAA